MKQLLQVFFVFLCALNLNAQQIQSPYKFNDVAGNGKLKGVPYSVKVQRLQVPQQTLLRLSTDALIETCLDYPMFNVFTAFNNIQEGFDKMSTDFNGFGELSRRQDAGQVLIEKYGAEQLRSASDPTDSKEKGKLKMRMVFLELMMAQPDYLQNCSKEQISQLLRASLSKYEQKIEYKYSSFNIQFSLLLMGRTLKSYGGQSLAASLTSDAKTDLFLKSVALLDEQSIQRILTNTAQYLTTNK